MPPMLPRDDSGRDGKDGQDKTGQRMDRTRLDNATDTVKRTARTGLDRTRQDRTRWTIKPPSREYIAGRDGRSWNLDFGL